MSKMPVREESSVNDNVDLLFVHSRSNSENLKLYFHAKPFQGL